jgi:hypothetical protein
MSITPEQIADMDADECRELLMSFCEKMTAEEQLTCMLLVNRMIELNTEGVNETVQMVADAINETNETAGHAINVLNEKTEILYANQQELVEAIDIFATDELRPALSEEVAVAHDDLVDLIIAVAQVAGISEEKFAEIAAKVRARSASSAVSYSGTVAPRDDSARNRNSVAGNGGRVKAYEAYHDLGKLLEQRPGCGLFSPGMRLTLGDGAPLMTEEVDEEQLRQQQEQWERDRAVGDRYSRAIDAMSRSPLFRNFK